LDVTERPVRSTSVLTASADGERVLLHPSDGTYFSLNEVAARVWDLCDGGSDVTGIVRAIESEFEASDQNVETDVLELLDDLARDGLITMARDVVPG
jgi:Coenzyme PQQ synthesis protein D (PqqD)